MNRTLKRVLFRLLIAVVFTGVVFIVISIGPIKTLFSIIGVVALLGLWDASGYIIKEKD